MRFDEIDWHDSLLIGIFVDRINPGHRDVVQMDIITPNSEKLNLTFEHVYHADIKMNFNVIADETISTAYINDQDEFLPLLKSKWLKISPMVENAECYYINTNSTNSVIKIYALTCNIVKHT